MVRSSMCAVALLVGPVCALQGDERKKTWQEADVHKLMGRWMTVREEKTDKDKIRRRRVELVFSGGDLRVSTFVEKDAQSWGGIISFTGVERGEDFGAASRLKLDSAYVYYDFVGEKLILVGHIGHRPFEGFRLSGEYMRAEKTKSDATPKDKSRE